MICLSAKRYIKVSMVLVFLVIVWGSIVRVMGAGMGCGPDWPTCNGEIIPTNLTSLPVFLEYFHRIIGGLTFLMVAYSTYRLSKEFGYVDRIFRMGLLSFVLLLVQVLMGMVLVKTGLDPLASALHLSMATFVFGTLVYIYAELGKS